MKLGKEKKMKILQRFFNELGLHQENPTVRPQRDCLFSENLHGSDGTVWLPKILPLHSENPTIRSAQQQPINRLCNHTGGKVEVPSMSLIWP